MSDNLWIAVYDEQREFRQRIAVSFLRGWQIYIMSGQSDYSRSLVWC